MTNSVLSKLQRGGEALPPRILLAGPEGIGKSTFAAQAPEPLFICQEDGLTGLEHVRRITPADFGEVMTLCDELLAAPGLAGIKTIVIDTTDWLERAIHAFICKRDNKANVEDFGYGKGYKITEAELVRLLSALDAIRHKHKCGVILLSHVEIKTFTSPDGNTWDRYQAKGHKGFTGILREWPDACLFAVYEVFMKKDGTGRKERASGGERIIHTAWSPGWDAKNRLNLPDILPLDYGIFSKAVADNTPAILRERFIAVMQAADIPEADQARWDKINVESLPSDRLQAGIAKLMAYSPKQQKDNE